MLRFKAYKVELEPNVTQFTNLKKRKGRVMLTIQPVARSITAQKANNHQKSYGVKGNVGFGMTLAEAVSEIEISGLGVKAKKLLNNIAKIVSTENQCLQPKNGKHFTTENIEELMYVERHASEFRKKTSDSLAGQLWVKRGSRQNDPEGHTDEPNAESILARLEFFIHKAINGKELPKNIAEEKELRSAIELARDHSDIIEKANIPDVKLKEDDFDFTNFLN